MRRMVMGGGGLLVPKSEPLFLPARKDERSHENNTEAIQGAPWIHFHHRTSDMSAAPRGKAPGRPCCVEMVCHACHKHGIVFFRVDLSLNPPQTVRGDEVGKVGNEFVQAHKGCRGERGVDYTHVCDKRRDGEAKVFDFAGALG